MWIFSGSLREVFEKKKLEPVLCTVPVAVQYGRSATATVYNICTVCYPGTMSSIISSFSFYHINLYCTRAQYDTFYTVQCTESESESVRVRVRVSYILYIYYQ